MCWNINVHAWRHTSMFVMLYVCLYLTISNLQRGQLHMLFPPSVTANEMCLHLVMSARRSERLCFYLQMSPVPGINPYSARWRSWPATAPSPATTSCAASRAASGAAPRPRCCRRERKRCASGRHPSFWRPWRPMGAWLAWPVSKVRTRCVRPPHPPPGEPPRPDVPPQKQPRHPHHSGEVGAALRAARQHGRPRLTATRASPPRPHTEPGREGVETP